MSAAPCRVSTARRPAKSVRAQLVGVALLMFSAAQARADTIGTELRLLSAIREVEAVKKPATPGPAGELGYFRLRPQTWRQHTTEPFSRCGRNASLELATAMKHLRWLARGIVAAGQVPTPYRLALAWNAGLEATRLHRVPAPAHDYAARVVNIFTAAAPAAPFEAPLRGAK